MGEVNTLLTSVEYRDPVLNSTVRLVEYEKPY